MTLTKLKKEGYFPSQIFVLHELKLEDYTPCYNYWNWFFEKFGCDVEKMTIFFSNPVWFHLSGYVNSQNYCIWWTNNPHVFEKTLLQTIKGGVWCTISKQSCRSNFFLIKLWTAMSIQK